MTKIKLCGMMRPEDIDAVNLLCPDLIGFVFERKSKRYVSFETARLLKERLDKSIRSAGVFVNEEPEFIAGLLREGIIDLAQLHGDEDDDFIDELRERTGCKVIKALKIRQGADLDEAYKSHGDWILLDAGAGDGKAFDWELLRGFDRPYFLAGGLDHRNVGEAVKSLRPYGVDVSSGIEKDGIKDPVLMERFVNEVRNYE